MSFYEIVCKCNQCGKKFNWRVSPNSLNMIERMAACPYCNNVPQGADIERLFHLIDTVDTFDRRTDFIDLSEIIVHRLKKFDQ